MRHIDLAYTKRERSALPSRAFSLKGYDRGREQAEHGNPRHNECREYGVIHLGLWRFVRHRLVSLQIKRNRFLGYLIRFTS